MEAESTKKITGIVIALGVITIFIVVGVFIVVVYLATRSNSSTSFSFSSQNAKLIGAPTAQSSDIIQTLTEGNQRFVNNLKYQKERNETKNHQHPNVVVVSCSDSRSTVPLIFDLPQLGKVFEIKTAAEALASSDIESIKYAITHLESSVEAIIVLGHTNCGGVKATVETILDPNNKKPRREYPTIVRNVKNAAMQVINNHPDWSLEQIVNATAAQNAIDKAKEIEFLLDGVAPIIPAIYDISSGKVTWL